jgi:hypothetical protein
MEPSAPWRTFMNINRWAAALVLAVGVSLAQA